MTKELRAIKLIKRSVVSNVKEGDLTSEIAVLKKLVGGESRSRTIPA